MTPAVQLESPTPGRESSDRRPRRYAIVNADDFGRSQGINEGILRAHAEGIVTSASLMVRWPAANNAVKSAQSHFRLSLGLHVDLGEWVFQDGGWKPLYEVVPIDDRPAVAEEINRQLDLFCELSGRQPTHLDSHQHVHRQAPVRAIMRQLADRLGVPLRHFDKRVQYRGEFYGQSSDGSPLPEAISVHSLANLLANLPAGLTEIGCHPGFDDALQSMYSCERRQEIATLCDPRIRAIAEGYGIEFVSFADLPAVTAKSIAETSAGLATTRREGAK
jgi:chitin disaccharide deacetylase